MGPCSQMRRQFALVRKDATDARQQAQFGETAFQILPRCEPDFFRRALGFGLIAAQEDVAADGADLQALRDLNEAIDIPIFYPWRVAILDCSAREFDKFRGNVIGEFVVRQALAKGHQIEQSRETPPVVRQSRRRHARIPPRNAARRPGRAVRS